VGAVLRSGQAFGASCVALGPGSADPFGPKAVRASMGAVFAVPVVRIDKAGELPGTRVALVAGQGLPLPAAVNDGAVSLMIGSEREGVPSEVMAQAEITAHIPIRTESLNAAMAATIALYEITRMAPSP
jgi:TrmH family RNA methyltransferase